MTITTTSRTRCLVIIGGNPAEAHPPMQHMLRGERNKAPFIVIDPRFTRTAARHRLCAHPPRQRHPGGLGHPVARVRERLGGQGLHPPAVYGMDEVRAEVEEWTPEMVEQVSVPPASSSTGSPRPWPRTGRAR